MTHRKKSKLIVDFGDWAKKPTEQANRTNQPNRSTQFQSICLNYLVKPFINPNNSVWFDFKPN